MQLVISTTGERNNENVRHLQTSLAGNEKEYILEKELQSQLLWSVLCNVLHLWVIVLEVVMLYRYSIGLMQRHAKTKLMGIIAIPKHHASC